MVAPRTFTRITPDRKFGRCSTFQAVIVEHLPHFRSGVILVNVRGATIAPKLDCFVANLAQHLEGARHVFLEFTADSPKLESNRNSHGLNAVKGCRRLRVIPTTSP